MHTGRLLLACLAAAVSACGGAPGPRLTFSGSDVGAEGAVIRRQLDRFAVLHPEVRVELRLTPDAADQRHQLYVQWLNARASEPDVLQLDIVWTAEFAAAGWLRPLAMPGDLDDFLPAAVEADRWQGSLYALPWFVDAGLLYWRRDLLDAPPSSIERLRADAAHAIEAGEVPAGLVWQGARYEGLVTVFLEHLAAFGGAILDAGGRVVVDQPPAVRALTFMRDSVADGAIVPRAALAWQEEQTRFAFQNGEALFMRNWPYAWALLQEGGESAVAGHVGVAVFPGADGRPGASALGGAQLAVNRFTDEPELAEALVGFLTAPEQMLERAEVAGQLPSRRSLYDTAAVAAALPLPVDVIRQVLDAAVPRPVTPVYSELSELLQVRVHRALTGQETPAEALRGAASAIRDLLARSGLASGEPEAGGPAG